MEKMSGMATARFTMDELGSHNSECACLSARLLHDPSQTVLLSDWSHISAVVKATKSLQCVEWILNKALCEQEWSCVAELAKLCSIQQRNVIATEVLKHEPWERILEVVRLGVVTSVRDAVLDSAVNSDQWVLAKELVEAGVSSSSRDQACDNAVSCQNWDLVSQLAELGVSTEIRTNACISAVFHFHVNCTSKLLMLGVRMQEVENALKQVMGLEMCDFVLQLAKKCQGTYLTDFVLKEAVKLGQAELVRGLVQLGLSASQMELACDEAVACQHWDIVLQLLQIGVSPSDWIVGELVHNNKGEALLSLFSGSTLTESLKGLLLMNAIRFGEGNLTVQILEQQSVSDAQLMEAIKYAVHLRDQNLLLQIMRYSPRSRRVFRENFHKELWKGSIVDGDWDAGREESEVGWMFDIFCKEREFDLALHIATTNAGDDNHECLISHFVLENSDAACLKRKKIRDALMKLHDYDTHLYNNTVEELCQRSKDNRKYIFHQALQLGNFSLIVSLCEDGVQWKEQKFALPWILANGVLEIIPRISSSMFFLHYATQFALSQYIKEKSEASMQNFLRVFVMCHEIHNMFFCHIFQSVIRKTLKFNCEELFVQVVKIFTKCHSGYGEVKFTSGSRESFKFAAIAAIKKRKQHLFIKACEEMFLKGHFQLVAEPILIFAEAVLQAEVWQSLPSVCALGTRMSVPVVSSSDSLELQLFNLCLQKMLKDQEIWPECSAIVEQWIRAENFDSLQHFPKFLSLRKSLLQEQWPFSIASLARSCLESSKPVLAFLLGFLVADWTLVETAINQEHFKLHNNVLRKAASASAAENAYSIAVALLKRCSVSGCVLNGVGPFSKELMQACQTEGLVDWALRLSLPHWDLVKENLHLCQNQVLLDSVLARAASYRQWDIAKELLARTSIASEVLVKVLRSSLDCDFEIAEMVVRRMDGITLTSQRIFHDRNFLRETVLVAAVDSFRLDMLHLCITQGLSTFQRGVQTEDSYMGDLSCPVLKALRRRSLEIIQLILRSGALTHRRLFELAFSPSVKRRLSYYVHLDEEMKMRAFSLLRTAAITPCRLEHLARLHVSHIIGCGRGRPERIQSLPVPSVIRDLVNFRDFVPN